MCDKWKEIWNSRTDVIDEGLEGFELYKRLKAANGFDQGIVDEETYYNGLYNDFISQIKIAENLIDDTIHSSFEVGCGSGANLKILEDRGVKILGGIDYSNNLLKIAGEVLKNADLSLGDASSINSKKYDLVFSEGVFHYFNSFDYAEDVVNKMINKANKLVFIGDVPDKCFEEETINYRRKQIDNYDERYRGLERRFYYKDWFEKIAVENNKKAHFTNLKNIDYMNARYSYNVFIY